MWPTFFFFVFSEHLFFYILKVKNVPVSLLIYFPPHSSLPSSLQLSLFFLDFFFLTFFFILVLYFFLISFYVQAAKRSVRTTGVQHRTFVDGLQNAKSAVAARQLHYQDPAKAHLHGADDPTYLKNGSGDKITFGLGMGLFGFSVLSVGSGMWNMAHGTGKLN